MADYSIAPVPILKVYRTANCEITSSKKATVTGGTGISRKGELHLITIDEIVYVLCDRYQVIEYY